MDASQVVDNQPLAFGIVQVNFQVGATMGRRHTQEGGGLIEELFGTLWNLGRKHPPTALITGAVLGAFGIYLTWISPKALMGFGYMFGAVLQVGAIAFLGLGIAGILKNYGASTGQGTLLHTINEIHALTWPQFEQMVADMFRRRGYRVNETGRESANKGHGDGGVDLVLNRGDGIDHLVQCKQYRVWKVGEPKVREFFGAMAAHQTRCEGLFVTCGDFTQEARAFASGKPLRLIDGTGLLDLLRSTNPLTPAVDTFATSNPPTVTRDFGSVNTMDSPLCPSCSIPMVRRVAGKGSKKGQSFWGCTNYPRCKQILD